MSIQRTLRKIFLTATVAILSGCDTVVMSPSGDIAAQQANLLVWATGLMLIIVLPVIFFILLFAWRYRAGNKEAVYEPDWDHSTSLELLIWAAPLAIVIALGALTWVSTHQLDPYRPLDRISEDRPIPEGVETLVVEVVAMDWKWLFFYPEQGIAVVNQLAAPVDRPIKFKITSTTMMNSFFIPALAGQIYAMGGMETKLHAVINEPGSYDGFSANYSGKGFNGMRFKFLGMPEDNFEQWVAKVKADGEVLSRSVYQELAKPSEYNPVQYYSSVEPELYESILNRCVVPGTPCMKDWMTPHKDNHNVPASANSQSEAGHGH
jgi:cytochrome o ubiquinol oxidase subunit 2